MGKMLGAVGLGSMAGAGATAASRSGDDSAVDTSEGPMTTTGTDSYRSPFESGPATSHHRKESIPTTAYPAGPDSARPIAPPVGGTRPSTEQTSGLPERESHTGRNAALGAGAIGAGAGAGAFGAHEYDTNRAPTSQYDSPTSTGRSAVAPTQQYDAPSTTSATQGVPTQQYNAPTHHLTTMPMAGEATREESMIPREEDHSKRNAALAGGAGLGAAGAGAYAANEFSQDHAEKEAARRAAEREKEMAHQQKEMEKQREAQAKQAEKEHKAAEKEAAKEEKAHQKEVEKQEKAQQKEIEKEEKAHQKELEKEEKARQRELEREQSYREQELARERSRREKEQAAAAAAAPEPESHHGRDAAIGTGVVGAAGAGAYGAHEHEQNRASGYDPTTQKHTMPTSTGTAFGSSTSPTTSRERTEGGQEHEMSQAERLHRYEDGKKRGEPPLVAAGLTSGAAGTGAAAHGTHNDSSTVPSSTQEGEPLEKKPSLLKRMFKRKNKDTGEDEEYEAEEEEHHDSHRGAATAGVAGAGAAGAGTYAATRGDDTGARFSSEEPSTTYEEKSGGFMRPSYNPFKTMKDSPDYTDTGDINNQHGNKVMPSHGRGGHTAQPTHDTHHEHAGRTGEPMPYGEKNENLPLAGAATGGTTARERNYDPTERTTTGPSAMGTSGTESSYDPTSRTSAGGTDGTPLPSHGEHDRNRLHKDPPSDHPAAQRESITGLPYDSSKDTQAGSRLSEHQHGAHMGEGTSAARSHEAELNEGGHKSFGDKLKEKLHMGGSKE